MDLWRDRRSGKRGIFYQLTWNWMRNTNLTGQNTHTSTHPHTHTRTDTYTHQGLLSAALSWRGCVFLFETPHRCPVGFKSGDILNSHTHTHTHIHTHARTHTHTHTHSHTHRHTHTHT